MTAYVALIRAVNVAGQKLLMSDLKRIADELDFKNARTFIASGNLIFSSGKSERQVKAALEDALERHWGRPAGVMVRTATEMAKVVSANPFADRPGNRVAAIFLDEAPPKDAAKDPRNVNDERVALGSREIYVDYPSGMGRSKLRIPAAAKGTARNMNTVSRLAELAKEQA
jgi:uncharacterized protein (DUF1697 family)